MLNASSDLSQYCSFKFALILKNDLTCLTWRFTFVKGDTVICTLYLYCDGSDVL